MNIHEENNKKKIGDLSKLKEDLIHNYKSRTPVPKNSSKLKAKRPTQKKLNLKSSSPKKDLIKLHKRNSNDFQEISAEHIKRMKNKGSKSVELFNHNQESKRNPLLKMLNHSNMPRSKSKKQEKHGKVVRVKKNNEKLKKKSSSPSDIKSKEHKNLDELINIQNLFKNCVLKRKKKTSMRKKPRTVLKEFKNIQENLNEKSVSHDKNKANLCIDVQNEEEVENSEYIGKNDSWFIRNESKLSDSLEIFSDINPDNIIDESEVIPKNFSFINTENLKLENKVLERKHSQSFDHGNNRIEFIQYETEYNISQKSEKIDSIKRSQLSISSQNSLKICPSTHPNRINKENFSYHYSSLQIFKQEKPVQSIQSQSNIHIPKSKPILLQVNNYPNSTHITSKASLSKSSQISIKASQSNHQALLSQLTEELSCNINNLFLIEQLKNFELVNYSIIESYTSTQITTKMKQFINHKFMTIINFLQPDLEYRISQFLSLLDSDETSEFLKMSQKKKEAVKKLLLDIQAADLPNFDKVIDSNVQNESNGPDLQLGNDFESFSNSSKESSTDEELQALGMQKFSTIQQGDEGIRGLDLMTNPGSGLGLKIGEDDKQLAQGGGNSEPSFLRLSLKLVACEQAEKNSFDNLGLMKYVDRVLLSIKSDELIKQISVPLSKDALKELDKIQDLQIGTYTDLEIRNFSHLFNYESALKLDIFPNSNELQDKQTELQETSFKLMALDNLNYFLQQFRPFSYKGKPLPWQRRKKFEGKVDLIDQVVEKVKLDFEFHSAFHLGKYEESLSESNDKLMRAHVTEKQINQILEIEIPLEEEKWTDYEFEETQVKIDLADVVLYELVTELININSN